MCRCEGGNEFGATFSRAAQRASEGLEILQMTFPWSCQFDVLPVHAQPGKVVDEDRPPSAKDLQAFLRRSWVPTLGIGDCAERPVGIGNRDDEVLLQQPLTLA